MSSKKSARSISVRIVNSVCPCGDKWNDRKREGDKEEEGRQGSKEEEEKLKGGEWGNSMGEKDRYTYLVKEKRYRAPWARTSVLTLTDSRSN